jgi:DNA primase
MRRVFAYLIKHRHIDRDIVSFFAQEKLIYESREQSVDKVKEYHNAIFVGYDENGVPRHAHKRGIYTEGKSFKGNIDSSNPCYSFHYLGDSDRIYVFEAPIDVLSFITIHKNTDWKKHSYVALCGISEQALMKMIEINPHISHVILCLDHDPAGIEASEKIADLLAEKNISCSRLLSNYKDWNEDLKADQNLKAIPAEEHPQHLLKNELCKDILLFVKEMEKKDIKYSDAEKAFFKMQEQNEQQTDDIEKASATFLCLALKEYRQLGRNVTPDEIVKKMNDEFRVYQNRGRWDPTLANVKTEVSNIEKQTGIISESVKVKIANGYENVALELLKSAIRYEDMMQKQIQTQSIKMT